MKKKIFLLTAVCLATLQLQAQFTFIHISDLHVSDTIKSTDRHDLDGKNFRCCINEFARLNPKPAFVAAGGDVSNEGNRNPIGMYPTITQYLFPHRIKNPGPGAYSIDSAQTIPIYFVPGNHDYFKSFTLIPKSSKILSYYPEYLSPDIDYAITKNNAVIIFLRSGSDGPLFHDDNPDNPEGEGISDEQCRWLRNTLAANKNKRKIIVMHHPPVDVAGTNANGTPYMGKVLSGADGSILNNRINFLNICDSNNVDIVLCGHVHQNVVANRNGEIVGENWVGGTRYVQTGSTLDRSYRIITISNGFVNVSQPLLSCNNIEDVNKVSKSPVLSVFLNSSTNMLTVECNYKAKIEILDIEEKIVKLAESNDLTTIIDVSELSGDVFIVRAITENGTIVKKFRKM